MSAPALGSTSISFRPFDSGDQPGVLAVLEAAFGSWPQGPEGIDPARFFRWKHMEGPFGPSVIAVAETDREVVGCAAWLRWRLRAGDRILEAVRAVDVAVHPAYRGRGIQVELTRVATPLFGPQAVLSFASPNRLSLSGSLKSGRSNVGKLPVFARPNQPLRWLRRSTSGSLGDPSALGQSEPAADALRDDHALADLIDRAGYGGDRLTTARGPRYLRWRYGTIGSYRAIRNVADGRIAGLAIFILERRGSKVVARVCELLVAAGDRRLARKLLRQVAETPAELIACAFPSRLFAARFGFVQAPGGRLLTARLLRQGPGPDPTQRSSWALSIGDLELL